MSFDSVLSRFTQAFLGRARPVGNSSNPGTPAQAPSEGASNPFLAGFKLNGVGMGSDQSQAAKPTQQAAPAPVDIDCVSVPESSHDTPRKDRVFLVGNQAFGGTTVRAFLQTIAGIDSKELPFGFLARNQLSGPTYNATQAAARKVLETAPSEVLDTQIPHGHTIAISESGELAGVVNTVEEVMNNESLRVGHHRSVTASTGGTISIPSSEDASSDSAREVIGTLLISPVMLDLNGDGKLGTTGVSTAKQRIDNQVGKTVSFDLDGDGRKENVEWMDGQGDGMLVDDRDGGATQAAAGDGEIDGNRLFGDQGGKFEHGYVKLAQHDANGDGKLTGDELKGLKTWVDDGDAKVEAGELKTLEELGITEISVKMNLEKNARGEDLMRSNFVQNGETKATEDVWFAKGQ